jgi:predicted ATPase with chaperone activity
LPPERFRHYVYLGELSHNGYLRGVTGVLPNAPAVREAGLKQMVVPLENATIEETASSFKFRQEFTVK